MACSRRTFVRTLGVGGAAALSGALASRGRSPFTLGLDAALFAAEGPILLHNNENPLGPGEAALAAMRAAVGGGAPAGRYPRSFDDLLRALAEAQHVSPDQIHIGCGSTQLLRSAVKVFTSPTRPLVNGAPSYEECTEYAQLLGTPVRAVPLDASLRLDLDAMAEAAKGAGLVYVCNPNNPTATVHAGDAVSGFVSRVLKASPDTVVLIDEAYHDYVTDPAYRSLIPMAAKERRLIVARTFSKAHGMAGLRVGYVISHADTIRRLRDWEGADSLNLLGLAAAAASIRDTERIARERDRNTEARTYTVEWFRKAGYRVADSQANFIFVDIGRPARGFREACRQQGVLVARDFPPFERSHVRISIGTLDEMKRATEVFGTVLAAPAAAA
ncbi:MAG TPA: aminotransferase class I/II-fold pyridoxal phosphate-dependent enzyme [Vicinamibacterales bacterium]|nr:aminotransferase class I/II-fold pyridoxal phosphate-dependent enzyme [Vicinamibacterales bacterium]